MADALAHLDNRTKLEWQASLKTDYVPKKVHRRTSIICTIGTAHPTIDQTRILTSNRPQDQLS